MKKTDKPAMYFVGAILRAFDKAEAEDRDEVTCSMIWGHVCMEAIRRPGAFTDLFLWDTSKAKSTNRIHTISECIRRGHVPGLAVDDRLRVTQIENNRSHTPTQKR